MVRRFLDLPWRIIPDWVAGNRLKILMYHSISANPLDPHAVSPGEFRRQMQTMQSKQVVSLREGLECLHSGDSLSNIYVITFDDALLDFYTNAMPILQEFDNPVTMFVPTGLVGGNAVWDSYDKSKPLMTWRQMEECQNYKVSFGSHTVNHVRLTECADELIKDELKSSLRVLREKLNNIIPALAYPGGFQDKHVRETIQMAGYTYALGASSRWGNGSETDLFQLRRERFH